MKKTSGWGGGCAAGARMDDWEGGIWAEGARRVLEEQHPRQGRHRRCLDNTKNGKEVSVCNKQGKPRMEEAEVRRLSPLWRSRHALVRIFAFILLYLLEGYAWKSDVIWLILSRIILGRLGTDCRRAKLEAGRLVRALPCWSRWVRIGAQSIVAIVAVMKAETQPESLYVSKIRPIGFSADEMQNV